MQKSETIIARDRKYLADTYSRYPISIEKGKGSVCVDFDGRKYVDFTSGIGVNSFGFSDDGWLDAVKTQLDMIQHSSNLFYTEPCGMVAEKMCRRTGMKKMFFCNSGAEAIEGAIKAVRKYSEMKYEQSRNEIITLSDSFHGRTMGALTATGQDKLHKSFMPLLEGFKYVAINDIDSVKSAISGDTCAIMMELIQGEGGVNVLDKDFVSVLRDICKEKDILLIVDEIQTGIGRTGKFMASEHYNITPDIITVAKGLGGGLPVGGILFGEKTEHVFKPGDHGSTFGGNPVVCAGANYILDRMDSDFLEEVTKKGEYLKSKLEKTDGVESVSGCGLMLGVTLKSRDIQDVVKTCLKNGLFILTAKNKLRLLPPLTIGFDEIDKGLKILQFAVK